MSDWWSLSWGGAPLAALAHELRAVNFHSSAGALLPQALALRPGHVKSRDQLMDAAYGDSVFLEDRTIDSHIKRIRRKFRAHDKSFDRIETLYGIGYKYKGDA